MDKNIRIDRKELEKQQREEILKKGEYAKVEIIIPTNGEIFSSVELRKTNAKKVAELLVIMQKAIETIEKQFPMASIISSFMDVKGESYIEKTDTETGEVKKWKDSY